MTVNLSQWVSSHAVDHLTLLKYEGRNLQSWRTCRCGALWGVSFSKHHHGVCLIPVGCLWQHRSGLGADSDGRGLVQLAAAELRLWVPLALGQSTELQVVAEQLREVGHLQKMWGNAEMESRGHQQPAQCAWLPCTVILLKVWERQLWQQHRTFGLFFSQNCSFFRSWRELLSWGVFPGSCCSCLACRCL